MNIRKREKHGQVKNEIEKDDVISPLPKYKADMKLEQQKKDAQGASPDYIAGHYRPHLTPESH